MQLFDPSLASTTPPPVIAGSPELFDVIGADLQTGRTFDQGHNERGDRVVVLGRDAAEKLGINRVAGQPAVFIGGLPYSVVGIIDSVGARENVLRSAIIPVETARADFGLRAASSLDIQVQIGAGQLVGRQAPIALDPNDPESFKVGVPVSIESLRGRMTGDVNVLFVAVGIVALIGGGIGIANVALLSVTERRGEIGLRRALGARTTTIAQQFILESLTTGFLGGLIGAALGLLAVVAVSVFQQWTPAVGWWVPVFGIAAGMLVGLVAGMGPGPPSFSFARAQVGGSKPSNLRIDRICGTMGTITGVLLANSVPEGESSFWRANASPRRNTHRGRGTARDRSS